jgi:hypothetical protein
MAYRLLRAGRGQCEGSGGSGGGDGGGGGIGVLGG